MKIYPISLANLYQNPISKTTTETSSQLFNEISTYQGIAPVIEQSFEPYEAFYNDSTLLIDQARTLMAIRQRVGSDIQQSIDSQLSGIYSQINSLKENSEFNFRRLFDGGNIFRTSEPTDFQDFPTHQVIANLELAQSFI
jgi:hypothetical protein